MQHKKTEYMEMIEEYIDSYRDSTGGSTPTVREIAAGVGLAFSSVSRYITFMKKQGMIEAAGPRSLVTRQSKHDADGFCRVPVLGAVSCGLPKFAEENIEEYVRLPVSMFGKGDFFILRAKGDSMLNAGIEDGDLVLVRKADTADYNQIVVAIIGEDEATLKRFRPDGETVRLHAENPNYDDIIVDSCVIQGIAVKVLKNLK